MLRPSTRTFWFCLSVLAGGIVFGISAGSTGNRTFAVAPQEKDALKQFMRQKLAASSKVLEGLAVEDPGLIIEGATLLAEMSSAEQWRVSMDPVYRQLSNEFLRTANKLVTAAKEDNNDRAALQWMDATMSCIKCHRYTRYALLAEGP